MAMAVPPRPGNPWATAWDASIHVATPQATSLLQIEQLLDLVRRKGGEAYFINHQAVSRLDES